MSLYGLLIREEWLDLILAGTKTWEIRGSHTDRRGLVALVQSGSGHVVGACRLVDSQGPLTVAELHRNRRLAGLVEPVYELPYARTCAWVLADAFRLPTRVPYAHPPGAVKWVRLDPSVEHQVKAQLPPTLLAPAVAAPGTDEARGRRRGG